MFKIYLRHLIEFSFDESMMTRLICSLLIEGGDEKGSYHGMHTSPQSRLASISKELLQDIIDGTRRR